MGPEVALILIVLILTAYVLFWGTIFSKAGFSGLLGLLMLIPLVNIIWLLIFACIPWPVHQQQSEHREKDTEGVLLLTEAARRESRGAWDRAAALYEDILNSRRFRILHSCAQHGLDRCMQIATA